MCHSNSENSFPFIIRTMFRDFISHCNNRNFNFAINPIFSNALLKQLFSSATCGTTMPLKQVFIKFQCRASTLSFIGKQTKTTFCASNKLSNNARSYSVGLIGHNNRYLLTDYFRSAQPDNISAWLPILMVTLVIFWNVQQPFY